MLLRKNIHLFRLQGAKCQSFCHFMQQLFLKIIQFSKEFVTASLIQSHFVLCSHVCGTQYPRNYVIIMSLTTFCEYELYTTLSTLHYVKPRSD